MEKIRMSKYAQYYDSTLNIESAAIANLARLLDYEVLDSIVELLLTIKANKQKVITVGCGTSGTAAKRIAHLLNCIEVPSFYLSPSDALHGAMGSIQEGDVVVMITKGGNTSEVISYIPCCKDKGAVIIGVTENADSVLAKQSDIVMLLNSGQEPCQWGIMPCSSTLCVMAAWDAIILTAMRFNGFTKEEFLRIHPNGKTADRLTELIEKQR